MYIYLKYVQSILYGNSCQISSSFAWKSVLPLELHANAEKQEIAEKSKQQKKKINFL